jgi:hypothetical protein
MSQPFYISGAMRLNKAIYLRRVLSQIGCESSGGKPCGSRVGCKWRVDKELDGICTAQTISILIVL